LKFKIKITQTLEGYAEIEAENAAAALDAAKNHFVRDGAELPDMEDGYPLHFQVVPEKVLAADLSGEERVAQYLKDQGHPHPDQDGTLHEFLNGNEKQWMYDEAVEKGYALPDVDRWFNLVRVLEKPISFRAAMMIDASLWEEDLDLLEANTPKDLFATVKGCCKRETELLISEFREKGTVIPNEWGVTDNDILILSSAYDSVFPELSERKPALSTLIQSADAKASSYVPEAPANLISSEPNR